MTALTGATLALERRRVGLNRIALARSLGVDPRTLSGWETRDATLPAALVAPIAAALWAARQAQARATLDRLRRLEPRARSLL